MECYTYCLHGLYPSLCAAEGNIHLTVPEHYAAQACEVMDVKLDTFTPSTLISRKLRERCMLRSFYRQGNSPKRFLG